MLVFEVVEVDDKQFPAEFHVFGHFSRICLDNRLNKGRLDDSNAPREKSCDLVFAVGLIRNEHLKCVSSN